MLVAVGMYLPLETTSAIFVGGCIRALVDHVGARRGLNVAQSRRVENVGILAASGMIAGEALVGLITATFAWMEKPLPVVFEHPSYLAGFLAVAVIVYMLVWVPLKNAGSPDEPAPPAAIV
jgi:hypothetical protein